MTLRRIYVTVVLPILALWLVVGLLWPKVLLVAGVVAIVVTIGVVGWLVDGDHVTVRKD
jgi:hypothetical protein